MTSSATLSDPLAKQLPAIQKLIAQGKFDRMVAWCHEGPRHADVTRVDVQIETPTGEPGFHVR